MIKYINNWRIVLVIVGMMKLSNDGTMFGQRRKRWPNFVPLRYIVAFQNQEELSLFEQCLRGSHNIV